MIHAPTPPSPRIPAEIARELRDRLGETAVLTDPDRLLVYEADGLPHYRQRPAAVVLPRDTDETAWVVGRLHRAGIAVVPRGAGTGLSGGAVAAPGAVLVGTSRMRDILSVDPSERRARVQAGVLNAELGAAAAPYGLHYAPDPSSQSACTLGGNVAENSGGPHCLKYGVTSRYVTGLTVVAAGGRIAQLGEFDDVRSPDWVGLFVGSEGCFGLATEVEVRLVPCTVAVRTLLAVFRSLEDAGSAVSAIIAQGLLPAALEILDHATITAVEESVFAAGYPRDAAAVLVIEFDGIEAELDPDAERAAAVCRSHGATEVQQAHDEAGRARLWKGRKKAFGALGRLAPDIVVQDATVPRSRLPDVLARIDAIGRRYDLRIANLFHAGDGNLHPNIVFDRNDADQADRVERASREIMAACVDAGGTITGEHGVGLDKREYMSLVHGPLELRTQHLVRRVMDPEGLWNPGKVLPDSAEDEPGEADLSRAALSPAIVGLRTRLQEAARGSLRVSPARDPGDPDATRLDLGAFEGIERYEPADLTLTAGAATTLDAIRSVAADAGQWLPVDAPGVDDATLGALVAAGVRGSLASAYGAMRDLVLGLTLVTGDGRVLRLGGQVVKNVAGFDLVRLLVGSRGALGVMTSVTVRLYPLPAAERSWVCRADTPGALLVLADAARGLSVEPTAIELGWDESGATLWVRSLGSEPLVETVGTALRAIPDLAVVDPADVGALRSEARRAARGRRTVRIAGSRAELADALGGGAGRSEGRPPLAGWALVGDGEAWAPAGDGRTRSSVDGSVAASPGGLVAEWAAGVKRVFDPSGVLPAGPFRGGTE